MSDLIMATDVKVVGANDVETAEIPAGLPLKVRYFGLTDKGQARPSNEDQFLIAELVKALHVAQTSVPQPPLQQSTDRCYLFVVADGIGGNAGGPRASALAVDSVEQFVLESWQWSDRLRGREDDVVFAEFRRALGRANSRVLAEASSHPGLGGMGTTLTLAFCLNADLFVAHAGDSRCYLFRQRHLYRLTADHTLAEEMVRSGALSPEEAARSRWSHVVTNAVGGGSPEVTVELHKVGLLPGDVLMLCSDGLTGMVSEPDVARVLCDAPDPEAACRRLVDGANGAGGKDNITAVVARFEEG
jgi:serine/threonine protein phosphatase PrpC